MAKDLYKYFRTEARDLLDALTRGALAMEAGTGDQQLVGSLLRAAHTLKGAARIVKQPVIADLAHAIEDVLSPFRDDSNGAPRACGGEVLRQVDEMAAQLATLAPPPGRTLAGAPSPGHDERFESVRVEVDDVENLLNSLSEASVQFTAIRGQGELIRRSRQLADSIVRRLQSRQESDRRVDAGVRTAADELLDCLEHLQREFTPSADRLERELAQTRDQADRLRLLRARHHVPFAGPRRT